MSYLQKVLCRIRPIVLLVIVLSLVVVALAAAPEQTIPNSSDRKDDPKTEGSSENDFFKFGFLAFGDLFTVPSHHLPEAEGDVSAWIRRIYLTSDFNLSKKFFARIRFEINQDGDFESSAFTIDFKDVYLRWSVGRHQLFFGLSPTPTFDLIDRIWGYRHLEKTPLDLQGIASRDNGIAVLGPLSRSGKLRYRFMLGTGHDIGKETEDGKKIMGAITLGDEDGFLVDFYGGYQEKPGDTDRTTFQVFTHYRFPKGHVGLQYAYQDRQEDPRLEVASAYGVVDLSPKMSLIGRVDRLLAPSPKGNDIPYLPFDPSAKATLFIGGLEWRPHRSVSLMPNIEAIFYDDPDDGEKPKNDLLLRITFYIHI